MKNKSGKKIIKKVVSHLKKDDKEFRKQIDEDVKLKKSIKKIKT